MDHYQGTYQGTYQGAAEACFARYASLPTDLRAETYALAERIVMANPPQSFVHKAQRRNDEIINVEMWKFTEHPDDVKTLQEIVDRMIAPWHSYVGLSRVGYGDGSFPGFVMYAMLTPTKKPPRCARVHLDADGKHYLS
jgi:hypothetical protein